MKMSALLNDFHCLKEVFWLSHIDPLLLPRLFFIQPTESWLVAPKPRPSFSAWSMESSLMARCRRTRPSAVGTTPSTPSSPRPVPENTSPGAYYNLFKVLSYFSALMRYGPLLNYPIFSPSNLNIAVSSYIVFFLFLRNYNFKTGRGFSCKTWHQLRSLSYHPYASAAQPQDRTQGYGCGSLERIYQLQLHLDFIG